MPQQPRGSKMYEVIKIEKNEYKVVESSEYSMAGVVDLLATTLWIGEKKSIVRFVEETPYVYNVAFGNWYEEDADEIKLSDATPCKLYIISGEIEEFYTI